jgi:hypothetical protein
MQKQNLRQKIRAYGLSALLLASLPIVMGQDAGCKTTDVEDDGALAHLIAAGSRGNAIDFASKGQYNRAQASMNAANAMDLIGNSADMQAAARAGKSTIVINNYPDSQSQNTQAIQTPQEPVRNIERFFTCTGFIDGINGAQKDGTYEYPKEFVGLGRTRFSTNETIIFSAILYDRKDSILTHKIIYGNESSVPYSDMIEKNGEIITRGFRFHNPSKLRYEWYLDGAPTPIGAVELEIVP